MYKDYSGFNPKILILLLVFTSVSLYCIPNLPGIVRHSGSLPEKDLLREVV